VYVSYAMNVDVCILCIAPLFRFVCVSCFRSFPWSGMVSHTLECDGALLSSGDGAVQLSLQSVAVSVMCLVRFGLPE